MTQRGAVAFFAGVLLAVVGFVAFVYAHEPTLGADPMAVQLLSRSLYDWLHYGGIGVMALGTLLAVLGILTVWKSPLEP